MKIKLILTALASLAITAEAKPLKVFILAGQSNMEGHAEISTFDYIGRDPAPHKTPPPAATATTARSCCSRTVDA